MENLPASFTSHGKKLMLNSQGLMVLSFMPAITCASPLGLLPLIETNIHGEDRVTLRLNASEVECVMVGCVIGTCFYTQAVLVSIVSYGGGRVVLY